MQIDCGRYRNSLSVLLVAVALAFVSGCASVPRAVERVPSTAFAAPEETSLGRMVAAAKPPPGLSGFALMASGDVAYEARLALIDRAEHSLDLQYFIVHDDMPTRVLMDRVVKAAARGVRVRILIDDLYRTEGSVWLASMSERANIQVRLFNPFPGSSRNPFARVAGSLVDLQQLTRRMHNKLFIVDNAVGIIGGRNLGAEYFARNGEFNFADLDVLAAGPIVRTLSHNFDLFWNDELSFPIAAFDEPTPHERAREEAKREDTGRSLPAAPTPDVVAIRNAIASGRLNLIWAPARAISDQPSKANPQADGSQDNIHDDVLRVLAQAKEELLIVSPYFVPGDAAMAVFRDLRARGVSIRVLTNSLATTDVPVAHAGYARRRTALLQLGVELHEFKLSPPVADSHVFGNIAHSRASLHAKAMVMDRRVAFVGSLNIDPRSAHLDTENGIIFTSPVIARRIATVFEHGAAAGSSYLVRISDNGTGLEWLTREGDQEVKFTTEPQTSLWLRLFAGVMEITAPEDQL